jgi:Tat protein secretion system quality control protein TatD with DNase activity
VVFIDTHAHLDFKDFNSDREQLVEQFRENNIVALSNTLNLKNYEYTKEIYKNSFDVVKVCPGLYPQDVENTLTTSKEFL